LWWGLAGGDFAAVVDVAIVLPDAALPVVTSILQVL